MDEKTKAILEKLLAEIKITNDMINGYDKKQFMKDVKTQRAVAMTLINIGELVKLLPVEFRQNHAEVPWREAAGLRDVVAHKYQTIRMEDVWTTVKNDIPVFRGYISAFLDV